MKGFNGDEVISVSLLKKYMDENRFDVLSKAISILIQEYLETQKKEAPIKSVSVEIEVE